MDDRTIILIKEPFVQSAMRDAVTVLASFALILPGVWMDSAAMQWLGFIIFIVMAAKWSRDLMGKGSVSIPQARKILDDLEAGQ